MRKTTNDFLVTQQKAMIVELRRGASTDALLGLKESLDFASGAWSSLFCKMGGAALLSQVCNVTLDHFFCSNACGTAS